MFSQFRRKKRHHCWFPCWWILNQKDELDTTNFEKVHITEHAYSPRKMNELDDEMYEIFEGF